MATLITNPLLKPYYNYLGAIGFAATAPLDNRVVINIDPTKIDKDNLTGCNSGAKTKGNIKTGLDPNIAVKQYAEDYTYFFVGMVVSVVSSYDFSVNSGTQYASKTLRLDNKNGSDVLQEWTWTEIGTGGDITTSIENALKDYYTKTETDTAITTKISSLGTVFRYKTTVADYNALQNITSPTAGDVYNVTASVTINNITYPAHTNFVYTSDKTWDALGGESALEELLKLGGSGTNNAIANNDILTATVSGSTTIISWKKAPIATTVTVDDEVVNEVGGVAIKLTTGAQDTIRTIALGTTGTVDVYSKDIIDAVVKSLNTGVNESIYWNTIQ